MTTSRDILRRILARQPVIDDHEEYINPYLVPMGKTVEKIDQHWAKTLENARQGKRRSPVPNSGLYYYQKSRPGSNNPSARPDLWSVDHSFEPLITDHDRKIQVVMENSEKYVIPIDRPNFVKKNLLELDVDWEDPNYHNTIDWVAYDNVTSSLAEGKSHSQHVMQSRLSWRNYFRRNIDRYGYHWGNKDIINNREYETVATYRREYLTDEYLSFPDVNEEFVSHTLEILKECSINESEAVFVGRAIFCNKISVIKLGFSSGRFNFFQKDDEKDPMDYIFPKNYFKWNKSVLRDLFEFSV